MLMTFDFVDVFSGCAHLLIWAALFILISRMEVKLQHNIIEICHLQSAVGKQEEKVQKIVEEAIRRVVCLLSNFEEEKNINEFIV